jgi:UDP-N-acetylmuramoyl-L-alanyl-D-glutamate--2,6-diaminopimelate ligase
MGAAGAVGLTKFPLTFFARETKITDSMKISALCDILAPRMADGPLEQPLTGLFHDSRQVEPGGVFFALRGASVDGHRFIGDALARGARAVVMEEERDLPSHVARLVVTDARRAMALAAAAYFGDPTRDMLVIGITGTNGKTTISYLLESVLRCAGRRPAVLGTVDYRFEDVCLPSLHTTPESVDLMRTIAAFRDRGADSLVLEVSSHAVEQRRIDGVWFDVGIFTNLTPEHLDYHSDMEGYFAAKRRLFTGLGERAPRRAVVNLDDSFGARLARQLQDVLGCGRDARAALRPGEIAISLRGIRGTLRTPVGLLPLESSLIGDYNLSNLLCAAGGGLALGLDIETVARGLTRAPQVPGRLERIENRRGALVLVDYAHTGDALDNVLTALRTLRPRRLLCVFGCGGDRDAGKRPVMGEIAGRLADLVVLTSDNPRSEDPRAILAQVEEGLRRIHPAPCAPDQARHQAVRGYLVMAERHRAIRLAVSLLKAGDVLLVAGKGHEDYQIVGDRRLHFDDREQLRAALAEAAEET